MRTTPLQDRPGGRASISALLASALSLVLVAAPSYGRDAVARDPNVITLEAENLSAFHDVGGATISATECDGRVASGGLAIEGLDLPGEYIQWRLGIGVPRLFRDSLCSAGDAGLHRTFAILFLPADSEGPPVLGDTLTTPAGRGLT